MPRKLFVVKNPHGTLKEKQPVKALAVPVACPLGVWGCKVHDKKEIGINVAHGRTPVMEFYFYGKLFLTRVVPSGNIMGERW